nr:163K exoantigen - malaria parasite (Plasmodium falciparum) (fragments) [Plasmodium falciparum]
GVQTQEVGGTYR